MVLLFNIQQGIDSLVCGLAHNLFFMSGIHLSTPLYSPAQELIKVCLVHNKNSETLSLKYISSFSAFHPFVLL